METSYIVTFVGDDRTGLVEELAGVISENGGNWLQSQSSQLAGKYAGLVLVEVAQDRGTQFEAALKALTEKGRLSVRAVPAGAAPASGEKSVRLTVIGPDRQGIVREITGELGARNMNVLEMETGVSPAPMSSELMFEATLLVEVGDEVDMEALTDRLEEIANRMTLDVTLVEST